MQSDKTKEEMKAKLARYQQRTTTEWQTGETSMCRIGKVCTRHIFTSRQSRLLWLDFSMCLSVWRKWKWNVRGLANLVMHATTYFHLVLIWCWFSSWSSELNFRYSHAGRRDLGPFFVKLWNSIVGCVTRKAHNYRIAPDNLVLATCSDCLSTIMQTQGWQKTNVGALGLHRPHMHPNLLPTSIASR